MTSGGCGPRLPATRGGSDGPSRAQLSARAYKKLVFHAAKYPAYTCVGVLVGTVDGVYDVADVVPLAHHWTTLSPMIEAGLALVRSAD